MKYVVLGQTRAKISEIVLGAVSNTLKQQMGANADLWRNQDRIR